MEEQNYSTISAAFMSDMSCSPNMTWKDHCVLIINHLMIWLLLMHGILSLGWLGIDTPTTNILKISLLICLLLFIFYIFYSIHRENNEIKANLR